MQNHPVIYHLENTLCTNDNNMVSKINSGINCITRNVVYNKTSVEGACKNMNVIYIGEIYRNIAARLNEHLSNMTTKNTTLHTLTILQGPIWR